MSNQQLATTMSGNTNFALIPPPGGKPSISSTASKCITYCSIAASGGPDWTIAAQTQSTDYYLRSEGFKLQKQELCTA